MDLLIVFEGVGWSGWYTTYPISYYTIFDIVEILDNREGMSKKWVKAIRVRTNEYP